MYLSSIVVVVLRLFGLYWVTAFVISLMTAFGRLSYSLSNGLGGVTRFLVFYPFLTPAAYLLLALLTWIFAKRIAEKVSGDVEFEVKNSNFGVEHLYGVGLLVCGCYLFFTNLGGTVNWLHYLAANQAGDDLLYEREGLAMYDVIERLVPCAGGLYLALYSGRFGTRLARSHHSTKSSSPSESGDS